MAPRIRNLLHNEETRTRIKEAYLINRLISYVAGSAL